MKPSRQAHEHVLQHGKLGHARHPSQRVKHVTRHPARHRRTRRKDLRMQFLSDWRYTRSRTLSFIRAAPLNAFRFSPNKQYGTLGRQLRHMADIQHCYSISLQTGSMDFTAVKPDKATEHDKYKMMDYFRKVDREFKRAVMRTPLARLRRRMHWPEVGNPTRYEALLYMKEHEIYHQGILQMYAALAGFKGLKFY
ncbi:DinB family protein [Candidatus Woesearchaeota archaeon]|nr:DinB family protein [Candidatus Woesearchaeota archaeon]